MHYINCEGIKKEKERARYHPFSFLLLLPHLSRERNTEMAMGGGHKGSSGASRGKPYGLMLLLAFGAALLGVMVVHKLRERRIFNLLVKEKDRELLSLQLLLQKEREYNKEIKRKNEEMKAKIYALRTQKMELDRRVLEMQSTVDSLKDEQKILEAALEEKQNEMKTIRQTSTDLEKDSPQVLALSESLKQKNAEIEDLKHRLENPVNIWSVSTDDPSNPDINTTLTRDASQKDHIEVSENKEVGGQLQNSVNHSNAANSTRRYGNDDASINARTSDNTAVVEGGIEKSADVIDRRDVPTETDLQILDNTARKQIIHIGQEDPNDNAESNVIVSNAGELAAKVGAGDNDMKLKDEGRKFARDQELGNEDAQQQGTLDSQVTFKGGVKLEMTENSKSAGSRGRRHVNLNRVKGKKWRVLVRSRSLESRRSSGKNAAEGIRNRKFPSDDEDKRSDGEEEILSRNRRVEREGATGANNQREGTKDPGDSKTLLNSQGSTNVGLDAKSNFRNNAEKQSLDEARESKDEVVGREENNRMNNLQGIAEQGKSRSNHERSEDTEVANARDDTDAAAGDLDRDAFIDSEDREEYREETDDSEF